VGLAVGDGGKWVTARCDAAGWFDPTDRKGLPGHFLFARTIHKSRKDAMRYAVLLALGGPKNAPVVR
jgi:hypothetical protein